MLSLLCLLQLPRLSWLLIRVTVIIEQRGQRALLPLVVGLAANLLPPGGMAARCPSRTLVAGLLALLLMRQGRALAGGRRCTLSCAARLPASAVQAGTC